MKTCISRNPILAAFAVAALMVYILACTSFSPDDKKVLFPAFDSASGVVGLSVYDRETRRTEPVFLPLRYTDAETNRPGPCFVRGQWTSDGKWVVVSWSGGDDKEGLKVAVVPWPAGRPVKVFDLPQSGASGSMLVLPLCISGDQLVFMTGDTSIAALDLTTGRVRTHEFSEATKEMSLLATANADGVLFLEKKSDAEGLVLGRLDVQSFQRKPLLVTTNKTSSESFLAYDPAGKFFSLVEDLQGSPHLCLYREGRRAASVPWNQTNLNFGTGTVSRDGKRIVTAFVEGDEASKLDSFGVAEISTEGAAIRKTTLLRRAQGGSEMINYFQVSLSHDGNTAAVASTYLVGDEGDLKPEDCALFLVNLSDPARKITRVPMPPPPGHVGILK